MALFWPSDCLAKTREAIQRRICIHYFSNVCLFSKKRKIESPPIPSPEICLINNVLEPEIVLSPPQLDLMIPSEVRLVDYEDSVIDECSNFSFPEISIEQSPSFHLEDYANDFSPFIPPPRFGVDMDDSYDDYRLCERGYHLQLYEREFIRAANTVSQSEPCSEKWPPLSLPADFFVGVDTSIVV